MEAPPLDDKAVGDVVTSRRQPPEHGTSGEGEHRRPDRDANCAGIDDGEEGFTDPAMSRILKAFKAWGMQRTLFTWLKYDFIDEDALRTAFNVPDSALASYGRWEQSIEGQGSYTLEETDRWLRGNGYTGPVSDGYVVEE